MSSPQFLRSNAGALTLEEILKQRVGRDSELAELVPELGVASSNIYLWGERGIGKTFLVRLLQDALARQDGTLAVNVSATAHFSTTPMDVVSVASGTLLAVLRTVWTEVIRRPYSDLWATLNELPEGDGSLRSAFRTDLEWLTVRLFREIRAVDRRVSFNRQSSVGATFLAKGELQRARDVDLSVPPILPFEFVEFTKELLVELRASGIMRLTIFLDEANVLDLPEQEELLSQYVKLFSGPRTNFLFVAGFRDSALSPTRSADAFQVVKRVEGLDTDACLLMTQKYMNERQIAIPSEMAMMLILASQGSPRNLLSLLHSIAYQIVGGASINRRLVQKAIASLTEKLEIMSGEITAHTVSTEDSTLDELPLDYN